jgi:NAD-dependent dihydropyrimidine dehydrogenase PreA subunit
MTRIKARLDITDPYPVKVDPQRCDLCGACVGVCPPDVIIMTERRLFLVEGCIKCGFCLPACPLEALSWNEPGDNGDGRMGRKAE